MSKILFIGSFIKLNNESGTGGQLYACTSLLESDFLNKFEFVLVDSTSKLPIPNLAVRLLKAIKRLGLCLYHLIFSKIDTVLIFSADGFSIIEKGIVGILSKKFGKKVVFAPRSGFIVNDLEKNWLKSFIKYVFKNADTIICQGNIWKQLFVTSFPKIDSKKFVVILNWIDINKYDFKEKSYNETSFITFLFLGWIEKEKGVEDLIRAVSLVKNSNFKIILAGNGSYYQEACKLSETLNLSDRIEFVGWVGFEKKIELLASADVFILPSHYEGMPNAIMEAMASGLPVISTTVGAIPEMIVNNENGFIGKPKSLEFFSDSITYFLENKFEIKRMAKNSRKFAKRNHNLNQAAIEIGKLIS